MPYSVHLRRVCPHLTEIRVFAPGQSYGDPWVWACNLQHRGVTAHLTLAKEGPPCRRAILRELAQLGFTVVEWERIKGGKVRLVRFAIGGQVDGADEARSLPAL